ncbi:MAG: hypothetical protein J7576_14050, partial [Siphonobacter aquaeclarae]|nr:hypothetical protein [Siphonobacter aquaeclarae]
AFYRTKEGQIINDASGRPIVNAVSQTLLRNVKGEDVTSISAFYTWEDRRKSGIPAAGDRKLSVLPAVFSELATASLV